MKVAAIDIGANAILCLIAEISPDNEILPLYENTATTRLGDFSQDKNEELSQEAVSRSLEVLRKYKQLFRDYQVEKRVIVATSVLREATNRGYFCDLVQAEIDEPVLILNEDQEAEFSYRGALSNKPNLTEPILVFDIGGGSTELIFGDEKQILFSESIPIGAMKLTKKFFQTDPVGNAELIEMQHFLQDEFARIRLPFRGFKSLIGVGGTLTTLAAMNAAFAEYTSAQIDGTFLDFSTIKGLLEKLLSLPLDKRKKVVGLAPERADIIIGGTVLLIELLEWLNAQKVMVSDRCVRYGAILKLFLS